MDGNPELRVLLHLDLTLVLHRVWMCIDQAIGFSFVLASAYSSFPQRMRDEVQHGRGYVDVNEGFDTEKAKRQCVRISEDTDATKDAIVGTEKVADEAAKFEKCYMCSAKLDPQYYLPHVRAPFVRRPAVEEAKMCHFWCVCNVLKTAKFEPGAIDEYEDSQHTEFLSGNYLEGVRGLLLMSPELKSRQPHLRVSLEEFRIRLAARCPEWPSPVKVPGSLPAACWSFDKLCEIRISSCPFVTTLPPEIGLCSGMKSLVLISDALIELPKEVGKLHELTQVFLNGNFLRSLPDEVGNLPVLEELCVDANLLESLPAFSSPSLALISAPANRLVSLPKLSGRPQRMEIHGNKLSTLDLKQSERTAYWDSMITLKLMGNQLQSLPAEVYFMKYLRVLNVAENRLTKLPDGIRGMNSLEWIFAYNNLLTDLPTGILEGRWLQRVLLEGNPLRPESTLSLLKEAAETKVRTVGLDDEQVRAAIRLSDAEEATSLQLPLPSCVSVGRVLAVPDGRGQYFLKLTRASHLQRSSDQRALGESDNSDPSQPRLLVVAFAASQGEPEWNGLLRKLVASGTVAAQRSPCGTLPDLLTEDISKDKDLCVARLWSRCVSVSQDNSPAAELVDTLPIDDFDVLSVVDHRMRWYCEEEASFHDVLRQITQRYEKTLFVGASMGGFGALLHGGRLADAVVAFGPQSQLSEATLRPPGADIAALQEMEVKVKASVLAAKARGSLIRVHCAADEHFWHALALPLEDLALTVHPLLPRKPFARLLNNAGLLQPIIADALYRALTAGPAAKAVSSSLEEDSEAMATLSTSEVAIASWTQAGCFDRYRASRSDALKLFFGVGSPVQMPRPGDWFCPKCNKRNMLDSFFCHMCGTEDIDASCVSSRVSRVTGGKQYPKKGDWGCRKCGVAQCGYDKSCKFCGNPKDSEDVFIIT